MNTSDLIRIILASILLVLLNILRIWIKDRATTENEYYKQLAESSFQRGYRAGYQDASAHQKKGGE